MMDSVANQMSDRIAQSVHQLSLDFQVPAGARRVRITAAGYQPLEFMVDVPANGTASLGTRQLTPTQ